MAVIMKYLATVLLYFFVQATEAGRPMEVDDAGIVDEGACQLETWGEFRRGQQSYWLTPACNIGGDWEVSVGSAWQQSSDSANAKIFEAQAKTVLVEGLAERLDIALNSLGEPGAELGDSALSANSCAWLIVFSMHDLARLSVFV